MMLIAQIAKQEGAFWSADLDAIGAYTQGTSRQNAIEMLTAQIELMVERPGFKASITNLASTGANEYAVTVTANDPGLLAALVLRHQREVHHLTLADVARRLGVSSISSYAAYEQGKREPSLSKYAELLAAVAPELGLIVGERKSARPTRSKRAGSSKIKKTA